MFDFPFKFLFRTLLVVGLDGKLINFNRLAVHKR
jgi:hypothetical protein